MVRNSTSCRRLRRRFRSWVQQALPNLIRRSPGFKPRESGGDGRFSAHVTSNGDAGTSEYLLPSLVDGPFSTSYYDSAQLSGSQHFNARSSGYFPSRNVSVLAWQQPPHNSVQLSGSHHFGRSGTESPGYITSSSVNVRTWQQPSDDSAQLPGTQLPCFQLFGPQPFGPSPGSVSPWGQHSHNRAQFSRSHHVGAQTFGPRPTTFEIFKLVMENHKKSEELVQSVLQIGSEEMVPSFLAQLRREFTTPEQTSFLKGLMSIENFAKFQDPAIVQATSSNTRFIHENLMIYTDKDEEVLFRADEAAASRDRQTPGPEYDTMVDISLSMVVPPPPPPKFGKLMNLPTEIRARIYEAALFTGQSIRPQLCDGAISSIKFHDQNQHSRINKDHNAITKLLGVTRVSKQIRAESLPCFYSANTFSIGADTATYFARLQHLGRFHMLRHVRFGVAMRKEKWAAEILQQMSQHIKDVEAYESPKTVGSKKQTLSYLRHHPQYIAGGLPELALFSCLGMLTSAFGDNGNGYTQKLVLPIPSTRMFSDYPTLQWFLTVLHGLGIHVHFLEGHELAYISQGHIGLLWDQSYQKRSVEESTGMTKGKVDVWARALEMIPEMEGRRWDKRTAYMRVSCDGNEYEWFDVWHKKCGAN